MAWTLEGKTCLLTGATEGIGRSAATTLAKQGATLVIVGRNAEKTARVVDEVKQASGNSKVEALIGDLSVQAEVRKVAREFKAKHSKLHVLLNNAGGIFDERVVTPDGIERTFALDHLAYFLLTNELLDVLKASAPARVVSVSSAAHYRGQIHFDDLNLEKGYGAWRAYNQAKLANILFTKELAHRLVGTGVTANCLHPGVVATGFGKNTNGLLKWAVSTFAGILLTPERGADTLVWLASAPEVEKVSGEYYTRRKIRTPSRIARDAEVARKLWQVSEQLVSQRREAVAV